MPRCLIAALLLAALPGIAAAAEESDSRSRSTAVALNYCRASFHRIRRYQSKFVLLEEQEKILNNLNLNGIVDEEVIRLYSGVLEEIGQIQIAETERAFFKKRHRNDVMRQLGFNAFIFGTQLATTQYVSALRTGANSWWDYRFATMQRDLDVWKVDKDRMGKVVDKSSQFLDTFWKLTQKKNIPDRWLVRGDDLDALDQAMEEPDPVVRLRVLGRMEHFMECYPPYWYYVGRTQQQLGQLFAAAETFDKLADLGAGHFRKDDMLAAALANRAAIQQYLHQPGAVETAREALKYSTDVWEANLMCARVLEAHGRHEAAEDAILRNLDVDLERPNSLVALLSLFYHTDRHAELTARLHDPAVVRDLPIPFLLQLAAELGVDKLPSGVLSHVSETLYAVPKVRFGPDDLVVAASSGWQVQTARTTLEMGGHRFDNPVLSLVDDRLELRFANVLDIRTPFAPLPRDLATVVQFEYADTPPIRVHLQQMLSPGPIAPEARLPEIFLHKEKEKEAPREHAPRLSIPRNVLRIVAIEVGTARLSLRPGSPADGTLTPSPPEVFGDSAPPGPSTATTQTPAIPPAAGDAGNSAAAPPESRPATGGVESGSPKLPPDVPPPPPEILPPAAANRKSNKPPATAGE